jgi:hypothetical protein
MNTIKIVNVETGQEIEREMNADELAIHNALIESAQNEANQIAAREATRQAVLNKLGLTADEVAALGL